MWNSVIRFFSGKSSSGYDQTLEDCVERATEEVYCRNQAGLGSNRACDYIRSRKLIAQLKSHLETSHGIFHFRYIGAGDNAVVAQVNDDLVIRFRAPPKKDEVNTQSTPKAPFIAPIWLEEECEGVRINFIPYLEDLKAHVFRGLISQELATSHIFSILREGFAQSPPLWFHDYSNHTYKFEQLGLLPDGTPIVIDMGAIIEEQKAPANNRNRIAEDKKRCRDVSQIHTDLWDGKWHDANGLQKIDTLLTNPFE